ncbi:MAG: Siderophore synthetase component-like protein [Gemmataceae bacterium]|nr:Siderophore synthetase component-like protein [Gemmataceae bacterium]
MKLDDVLHGNDAFVFMERYVDEAARTYSPFAGKSEVAPEYQPRSERPSFELVTVCAPGTQVSVFEADPVTRLRQYYVRPESVLFAVHPEIWSSSGIDHLDELHGLPRGNPIRVAPTASTRTVFVAGGEQEVPAHFLKLHYPRRISRFNRRLRRKNIHNSVEGSRDLEQVRRDRFAYLPDSLGFTYGGGDNPWGFLVREAVPRPYQGERFLIPYFALYAGDLKHAGHPPLLVQLIERLGVEPMSFVVDEIMVPVLDCWAAVVRERGILLECHAQNVLLEIDRDFRPRRVVHRDFDVWVDAEARRRAGLDVPFIGTCIEIDTPYPKEQHYSLTYDRFMGRELFDYLLEVLKRFYTADADRVRHQVVEAFHRRFPDSDCCFPAQTTFYFSNELLPGNDFRLIDTKEAPEWR